MKRQGLCIGVWGVAILLLGGFSGVNAAAPPAFTDRNSQRVETTARSAYHFVDSIGVNTHFAFAETRYGSAYARVKARLLELGVKHIRDGSMRAEKYKAGMPSSRFWNDLAVHGIRLHMIAHARWSASDILDVLEANRAAIIAIEGMNEPDLFLKGDWVTQARDFQELLYTTVKNSAFAQLPVVGPALARPTRYGQLGDLSAFADLANIHPYNGGRRPLVELDMQKRQVRQVVRGKPIVATEAGYHSAVATKNGHLPISEAGAAKYLPRMVFDYFEQGIARTYFYQLYDHIPPSTDNPEANFGLVRYDFTVRPAFTALANLIQILADTPGNSINEKFAYTLTSGVPSVRSSLLRKFNGIYYLALWQDVPVWDRTTRSEIINAPVPVLVSFAKTMQIARYQPGISAKPLEEAKTAAYAVKVLDEVVVLEIKP